MWGVLLFLSILFRITVDAESVVTILGIDLNDLNQKKIHKSHLETSHQQ